MEPRIRIFVGAYGSGKTEVAINYTFRLQQQGLKVAIADLDLVNPYFRSRELRESFEARGIRVLAPGGELAQADLPIVTREVRAHVEEPEGALVLDVGGDDAGSRALAQFAPLVAPGDYEMFMVVNDRRPWTGTVEGIREAIARVEKASRFRVTGLFSNPNLADETTPEVIEQGHALVVEAGRALGLPVKWLGVMKHLLGDLDPEVARGVPILALDRHLLPPWYEDPTRFYSARDGWAREAIRQRNERSSKDPRGGRGGSP